MWNFDSHFWIIVNFLCFCIFLNRVNYILGTYCHVDRHASLSVGKLLLHHYKSGLAHTSDRCSSVIELYLSEI